MMDNFQWTDELVQEYARIFSAESIIGISEFGNITTIESFKKSKMKTDFEIILFTSHFWGEENVKFELFEDGKYYAGNNKNNRIIVHSKDLEHALKSDTLKIFSIKRLSDNKIFSVGDVFFDGKIKKIELIYGGIFVTLFTDSKIYQVRLSSTSIDNSINGDKKLENDVLFCVFSHDGKFFIEETKVENATKSTLVKKFSSLEDAERFIIENEKSLSITDLKTILKPLCDGTYHNDIASRDLYMTVDKLVDICINYIKNNKSND